MTLFGTQVTLGSLPRFLVLHWYVLCQSKNSCCGCVRGQIKARVTSTYIRYTRQMRSGLEVGSDTNEGKMWILSMNESLCFLVSHGKNIRPLVSPGWYDYSGLPKDLA